MDSPLELVFFMRLASVAKDSSDPYFENYVFVEGIGLIFLLEAVCVSFASIGGVVCSFPNIDVIITLTADFVSHTLSHTSTTTF